MTEQDPDGHRQMLVTAAEVQRTGRPGPAAPWSELKAELDLTVPQGRTGFLTSYTLDIDPAV